jgi:1-acyl-sn-glycerol-3-phosphate acyltransferase
VLHALASIEVQGMEHCPPGGEPVLLVSNHLSTVDIPFVGAWAPRPIMFFAKIEVRGWPLIGWVSEQYGTIYVRRGESDRQAMRDALSCLAANQMVGMFPEGHRSHGRGLQRALPGIALMAQRSGARVWPVAVTGTEGVGRQLRAHVALRGGPAFDPLQVARDEHGPAPSHQDVADSIMRRVAALLPESHRGAYR